MYNSIISLRIHGYDTMSMCDLFCKFGNPILHCYFAIFRAGRLRVYDEKLSARILVLCQMLKNVIL